MFLTYAFRFDYHFDSYVDLKRRFLKNLKINKLISEKSEIRNVIDLKFRNAKIFDFVAH